MADVSLSTEPGPLEPVTVLRHAVEKSPGILIENVINRVALASWLRGWVSASAMQRSGLATSRRSAFANAMVWCTARRQTKTRRYVGPAGLSSTARAVLVRPEEGGSVVDY